MKKQYEFISELNESKMFRSKNRVEGTNARDMADLAFMNMLAMYILYNTFDNLNTAIITPDKDIIPDAENLSPAYIVFNNYEIILKWNRSLRFSLAVCTLKDKFKNEL